MPPLPHNRTHMLTKCCPCHAICCTPKSAGPATQKWGPRCARCARAQQMPPLPRNLHAQSQSVAHARAMGIGPAPNAAPATQSYARAHQCWPRHEICMPSYTVLRLPRKWGPRTAQRNVKLLGAHQLLLLPRDRGPKQHQAPLQSSKRRPCQRDLHAKSHCAAQWGPRSACSARPNPFNQHRTLQPAMQSYTCAHQMMPLPRDLNAKSQSVVPAEQNRGLSHSTLATA